MSPDATPTVASKSGQLSAVNGDWDMLRALLGGTSEMRRASKSLLPQWPGEDELSYKTRLGVAVLHPAFSYTCSTMSAKPFSRPITFKVPANIEELFSDIDQNGTSFSAFAMVLFHACLSEGMQGILVEYPIAEGIKTKADEKAAGLRPYLTTYPKESIIGWRTDKKGLTQLRLMENVEEEDGEWGVKNIEQIRVLTRGAWETFRQNDKKDWISFEKGASTITDEIPFVFFYGNRLSFGVGQCPMLNLAFQNVEHYQSASDQQTILHVARVPILFGKGFGENDTITIGSSQAVMATAENADLKFVEHTGKAVDAGAKSLEALEDRMRATGADLLTIKPGQLTATQVASEDNSGKSLLQSIAEIFEESLETCLNFMAKYIGDEQNADVVLYKDFSAMSSSDPAALSAAKKGGAISSQTYFEELRRRDVISPDRDWETEKALIVAEDKAQDAEGNTEVIRQAT